MYHATNGVNTHKGIIYSMGIICGAIGRKWNADTMTALVEEFIENRVIPAKKAKENK